MTPADARSALRTQARAARRALTADERREKSEKIAAHVLAWPAFEQAETVMAYASTGCEVETRELLSRILSRGKRLLLPRCARGGAMDAAPVTDLAALAPGLLGILEPQTQAIDPMEIDLILVPGLAFDACGNRLGQGGGYYDRFLRRVTAMTLGLAFHAQMSERLVTAPHDVPVDAVATESGIVVFRGGWDNA